MYKVYSRTQFPILAICFCIKLHKDRQMQILKDCEMEKEALVWAITSEVFLSFFHCLTIATIATIVRTAVNNSFWGSKYANKSAMLVVLFFSSLDNTFGNKLQNCILSLPCAIIFCYSNYWNLIQVETVILNELCWD